MICTTYFLTFFSELIPPTGYLFIFIIKVTITNLGFEAIKPDLSE
jgi:hypothetical protein